MNRLKTAQLLFADPAELGRLIEEAELPEEFFASYTGGLRDTVSPDFRELLEHCEFLALDSELIQRGHPDANDGMDERQVEKYRANLCQRLVGGMFVRLVVLRAQHAGGRIRDPQQRALLEWISGLQQSLDELVQDDTRSELNATIVLVFDRPLVRSDVVFLQQLRAQPIVKRVYVMTERLRVTGEGRGLIHSRYVWPLAVGPLLLRISATQVGNAEQDRGPQKAPLLGWRAGIVPSAGNRSAEQKERVRDVSQIFFGDPSKQPRPKVDSGIKDDEQWIEDTKPTDATANGTDDQVQDPPTRVGRLLDDNRWKRLFQSGAERFAQARVKQCGFDDAGKQFNAQGIFWSRVSEDPKNLFLKDSVAIEPAFHATADSQQTELNNVRQRQRDAEYEVACARGCAREWAVAESALVSLPYRFVLAALPAVMLLGFPAYLIFYRFFNVLVADANNMPLITFSGAIFVSVVGAMLGAWLTHHFETKKLQEADARHQELVEKVNTSRWSTFRAAGEIVRSGENFRLKELAFHRERHRARLVDRARSLMAAGLRDAKLDRVDEDVIVVEGIPEAEHPLALEDIREFQHALKFAAHVQSGKLVMAAGAATGHAEEDLDIHSDTEIANTDAMDVNVEIRSEWQKETPLRDSRKTGRLPARWLRTFVARLAKKFRFNEATRADERARKQLRESQVLRKRIAQDFQKFFENQLTVSTDRFRSPLLSVETVSGSSPQRSFFVVASEAETAKALLEELKGMLSALAQGSIPCSALAGRVSSIGCSALCFEEIQVKLDLPRELQNGETSVPAMHFTFDEAGAQDDTGSDTQLAGTPT